MSVDSPAPFSPTRAMTSPALTSRSTPSSARVGPKLLRTPLIVSRALTSLLPELGPLDLPLRLQLQVEQLADLLLADVVLRHQVFAGREVLAAHRDVVALEVPHQRPDAEVAHAVGVLHDQPDHVALLDRLTQWRRRVEAHEHDLLVQVAAAHLVEQAVRRRLVDGEDAIDPVLDAVEQGHG